ncbi:MAG: sodium:solute symporter [Gammaproteobacteria bacterium 28-57-27]|nr:MAG: sodium:solute symporter [Gammaproteobacteria bacterium 28-57-27]
MLTTFVIVYLALSMLIGVLAARHVRSAGDFVTAGRSLPLFIVVAMVFATWFGAEAVLGIPATFLGEDLGALISDPFGAAFCLIFFGVFFARKLYAMNLMTIGDFYRQRYGRKIEIIAAIAIALSYLGWVSAQVMALGVVFNVLSDGALSQAQGILIGAGVVFFYTVVGGMWSVALTTAFQMVVIVGGLIFIAYLASTMTGGVMPVVEHAVQHDKFNFWPEFNAVAMLGFLASFLTLAFGSIPQQDVFQRANASKTANVAVWGTIIGGVIYLAFAVVPLFLTYSAQLIDPELVARLLPENGDSILPELIKAHLPLYAQVIFYGALLAVIMSTASGTLLAPSVTLAENVLKGWLIKQPSDRQMLWLIRGVITVFTLFVVLYTLWSLDHEAGIHAMVEAAYKVTLVVAFVPLVAGLYWSRANTLGAYLSIGLGVLVWIPLEFIMPEAEISPHFWGFLASIVGMVVGGFLRKPARWERG